MNRLLIDFAVQDRGLVLGTEFWMAVLLQLIAGVYLLGVGLGGNAKDLPPPTSRKDPSPDVPQELLE